MRKIAVKWFNFNMAGAPALNGIAGSLLAVLDACLIDGFNVRPVTSFVIAGGVGTLTFQTTGPGYSAHQVISLAGADDGNFNGDWRVSAVGSNTVTVDATGVADTIVASAGGLSVRAAPAGWSKPFSGTNLAAYSSVAQDATGILLRVDDTVGVYAKVRGYESMSDINTGVGMFPSSTQRTESNWGKTNAASTAGRQWTLISDDRFLYLIVHSEFDPLISYPNNRLAVAYGDPISYKSADAYHALLTSSSSANVGSSHSDVNGNILALGRDYGLAGYCGYLARSATQTGGSVEMTFLAGCENSGLSGQITYPNPTDNSLLLDRTKLVVERAARSARGEMPGFWTFLQYRPLTHGDMLETAVPGRVLFVVGSAYSWNGADYSTRWAIDITGPWR